ncbi:hypothetical protein BDZ85DRAFT_262787 [Elsinoe ampelina]|uniref:Uncharacterized protein n=1 Tax=Elsinoe ampelina TaxID=302913 RepID=A0A6A6GCA5_9PEZI|nr:hypothetical protein BDZ85DRAFT_262787 [Elsinoe ampelina]
MADAYCGPSNALQSFQKHTSVDRTLQQDRLTQRRSPLQGFRSQDANVGLLDPEFEAFQASQPGPLAFAEPAPQTLQSFNQKGKQPVFGGVQNGADWAADFQRLQVSSSGPQLHHSPPPAQFASPPASQSRFASPAPAQSPAFTGYRTSAFGTGGGYASLGGMGQGFMPQPLMSQGTQQPKQEVDIFDEAAFERAFDMAKEQIMAEEGQAVTEASGMTAGQQIRGNDTYPHLSLMRMLMWSQLSNPTEENMHKFARSFTLLEKHDPAEIDSTHVRLFDPMFELLQGDRDLIHSPRYELFQRAWKLRNQWKAVPRDPVPDVLAERVERATAFYNRQLNKVHNHKESHVWAKRNVLDDEMMHDIEQQVGDANVNDVVERVFDNMTASQLDPILALQDEQGSIVDIESDLLQARLPERIAKDMVQGGRTQDPLLRLWGAAYMSALGPETVELRDQTAAHEPEALDREQFEEAIQVLPEQTPQEQQQEDPMQHDENDDLARTAGELLDKVRDNQSTKFQNSTFLDLMRKLRDREVRVEGDKMVETNLSALDGDSTMDTVAGTTIPTQASDIYTQPYRTDGVAPDRSHSDDLSNQRLRDGDDVVRMLDEPGTIDQDPEFMMTSPFYDNQHAELGRRGLFNE